MHFLGTSFSVFPLIRGVPAVRMARLTQDKQHKMAQALIGARWKSDQRTGKNTPQVSFMGYLDLTWKEGYQNLVRFTFSGYQSDACLQALVAHCKSVMAQGRIDGESYSPVQWLCTFTAGEGRSVGQGERSTTIIPIKYALPAEMTQAPDALIRQAADEWESVGVWAEEYSGMGMAPPPAPARPAVAAEGSDWPGQETPTADLFDMEGLR